MILRQDVSLDAFLKLVTCDDPLPNCSCDLQRLLKMQEEVKVIKNVILHV